MVETQPGKIQDCVLVFEAPELLGEQTADTGLRNEGLRNEAADRGLRIEAADAQAAVGLRLEAADRGLRNEAADSGLRTPEDGCEDYA